MENRTKIILVRHGHSLGNATKTFLGHTDLDLSDMGYLQAKATGGALLGEKIDIIYSSDLKRAYNTAKFIAESHNLEIIADEELREVYAGDWENKTVDQLIAGWGIETFTNKWKGDFGRFEFPNGETIRQAVKRFYDKILRLTLENQGKTLLICSHAAVIRGFWAEISGIQPCDIPDMLPFATNASYSILYYENGKFEPFRYSIDEHLNEVGITKVNLI